MRHKQRAVDRARYVALNFITIRTASHRGAKREFPGSAFRGCCGNRGAPESAPESAVGNRGAPESAPEGALPDNPAQVSGALSGAPRFPTAP